MSDIIFDANSLFMKNMYRYNYIISIILVELPQLERDKQLEKNTFLSKLKIQVYLSIMGFNII